MALNHLEQLVAEWYEFQGYYVRRNAFVGRLSKGGYTCELDVIAFHPESKHLVHIESAVGSDSWEQRERRYVKKFEAGRRYIPEMFKHFGVSEGIDQIALFIAGNNKKHSHIGGGRVVLAWELLREIMESPKLLPIGKQIVPEQFGNLRTLQFVREYKKSIWRDSNNRTEVVV